VCIGVEHEISDAWSTARVERLFETFRVECLLDYFSRDDGDRLAFAVSRRKKASGFARAVNFRNFLCS
jgi:hypothetical protein